MVLALTLLRPLVPERFGGSHMLHIALVHVDFATIVHALGHLFAVLTSSTGAASGG